MRAFTGRRALVMGWSILFIILAGGGPALETARADKTQPPPETEAGGLGEGPTPIRAEKIDQTAEKIGKGIEKLGEQASQTMGSWVQARVYGDITWLELIVCALLLFLVVVVQTVLHWVIHSRTKGLSDDLYEEGLPWRKLLLRALSKPLYLFVWAYGLYGAFSPLLLRFREMDGFAFIHLGGQKAADICGTIAIFWFMFRLVRIVEEQLKRRASATENQIDDMLIALFGKLLRITVFLIGGVIVIKNLTAIEIGPLVASLGIGGIALALAARDSIANFFGTLTILFDKPFKSGQMISINGYTGTVETVGFRSTRIRTLTGHLVSIPNEQVVNSTLENIGKRPYLRWYTELGLTYDTPPDKLEQAVAIVKAVLDNHEGMQADLPPQVHFNGFGDFSLKITVFAWYHPADYWAFQNWLQTICLAILRRFEAEGIEFAFPSQTVYLANDDRRQLKLAMDADQGTIKQGEAI